MGPRKSGKGRPLILSLYNLSFGFVTIVVLGGGGAKASSILQRVSQHAVLLTTIVIDMLAHFNSPLRALIGSYATGGYEAHL